jgi:alpha-galactosidase
MALRRLLSALRFAAFTTAAACFVPITVCRADVAPVVPGRIAYVQPSDSPQINYPRITGATPGRPFEFMIPATGKEPMTFSAKGLPAGLTLDPATGIITGSLTSAGTSQVEITVKNKKGKDRSTLTIDGGERSLALTPPMGWDSWDVWAAQVDEQRVKDAADAIVSTGLAAHGYEYVNLGDSWEGGRDASGNIQSNDRFPDMKALADYIHAKGLKAGIYSSPGPTTGAGFAGSYKYEDQDAKSYANWGFDYLKYDWRSTSSAEPNPDPAAFQKPYAAMRDALDKTNRDIVFSIYQSGMGYMWTWGRRVGANCWQTANEVGDADSWDYLHEIYEDQDSLQSYAGPSHWNDPGVLLFGGTGTSNPIQDEQILHFSLWCLLSAPLVVGCDPAKLDRFALAVLTNDEAIAIDQDALGNPADKITTDSNGGEIWARPLSDGSKAVGLINPTDSPLKMTVYWQQLSLSSPQAVRDLWLHKDVGTFNSEYTVLVPIHGAALLKIVPSPDSGPNGMSF